MGHRDYPVSSHVDPCRAIFEPVPGHVRTPFGHDKPVFNQRSNQKAEVATTLSDSAAELEGSEFVGAIGALSAGDVVIGARVNAGFAVLEREAPQHH